MIRITVTLSLILSAICGIAVFIGLALQPESAVLSFASTTYNNGDDDRSINHQLTVMDIHRSITWVPVSGMAVGHHSWSPDGDRIALTAKDADGIQRIYVINADGTTLHPISPGGQMPRWYDERTIIYRDNDAVNIRYQVDVETGNITRLPNDKPITDEMPTAAQIWAGDRYAMQIIPENYTNAAGFTYTGINPDASGAMFRIFLLKPDGTSVQLTHTHYRDDYFPAWRP